MAFLFPSQQSSGSASAPHPLLCSPPLFQGFTTIGIVQSGVNPDNITLLDQSPHQLEKARGKPVLKGVTIVEGDGAGETG